MNKRRLDQNMKYFRDPAQTAALAILILLIVSSAGGTASLWSMQSIGYTSGYQGARASFAGVKYGGKMNEVRMGTVMDFDPDEAKYGQPNLVGEMSGVFVPRESLGPAWIPTDWIRTAVEYIHNPADFWEWELKEPETNTTFMYRLEEWQLKWYVSIAAQWSADWNQVPWNEPAVNLEYWNKVYSDTEIWFKLDLTPIWYFEGQSTAYFAIAKITLSDIAFGGKLNSGETKEGKQAAEIKVNPESEGSYLTMYYSLGGTVGSKPEIPATTYQGKKLNPALFTDYVYTYVGLSNFGTRHWSDVWGQYASGDVVTMGFNVHVFVIGQWDVQDVQDLIDYEDYGKNAQYGEYGWGIGLADALADPRVQALLTLLAMAAFFLIILIAAPGFLIAVLAIFMGRRRK
jgi:hypothetical protein